MISIVFKLNVILLVFKLNVILIIFKLNVILNVGLSSYIRAELKTELDIKNYMMFVFQLVPRDPEFLLPRIQETHSA